MTRLVPTSIVALFLSDVALVAGVYVVSAYALSDIDPLVWLLYEDGLLRIGVLAACLVLGLYFQDLYSQPVVRSKFNLFQQLALVLGVAFFFQALVSYIAPSLLLPRMMMMTGSLALLILFPLWRILYSSVVLPTLSTERVLLLGAGETNRRIAAAIRERPELGLTVAGFVAENDSETVPEEGPLLGTLSGFRRIAQEVKPNRIIVELVERRERMPVLDLLDMNFSGIAVEDAAMASETIFGLVPSRHLRPSQLIFSRELGPRPGTLQLQALYSAAIGAVGLLVAAPVMILVAILTRLTSSGPALFRQARVGRNGQIFTLYKFRSMRQDAEATTGAVWAARGDPRITGFGRFMRRTRLDELPQLFNVIRGEMSIVGPRPERPEFVAELSEKIPFYRQRHCVRPGITGWAQINHKYGDTIEDTVKKLEYDLYYIKHLSPALDFYIMFHTAKVMLLTRGAQ